MMTVNKGVTTMNKKETILNCIKNVNPQKLKDYMYDMINSLEEEDFIEGKDNGYNDGYGALQDVYIDKLLIDCTLLNRTGVKVQVDQENTLTKASANYLDDAECYEVELIKNPVGYGSGHDTEYRIEFIDNDYIDITKTELKALKEILNDETVNRLLGLEELQ